ncbi:putative transcription factor C2H2 family [Helianthus anomalus]
MSRCSAGYRSAYEPENGLIRFDGAYRIEKCWRKSRIQGRDVWRYLFVRCDNNPAAWTRSAIALLQRGIDVIERKGPPYWDYDNEKARWLWKIPLIVVQRLFSEKLLKEFACNMCNKVMDLPLTTPCAHNFCKSCLLGCKDRNVMRCPSCGRDIYAFLLNPQVYGLI